MNINEALSVLRDGGKVRLPEWTGYWFMENGKIKVFTRTGDILETPNFDNYSMRQDWVVADDKLGFDFVILALKAGKSVRKKAWAPDVFLTLQVPDDHSKMTAPYIFVTSRFGRVPWIGTQIEQLSNDWEIYAG
jgi:hypothetical protein